MKQSIVRRGCSATFPGADLACRETNLFVDEEHTPSCIRDADERVDDVGTQVAWNVCNPITADAWSVHGPVGEITNHPCLLLLLLTATVIGLRNQFHVIDVISCGSGARRQRHAYTSTDDCDSRKTEHEIRRLATHSLSRSRTECHVLFKI